MMLTSVNLKGKKVVFIIASNGYQSLEYDLPKELLESIGIKVLTASDKPGGAVASDESTTPVDITIDKLNVQDYDGIFFIGGSGAMKCLNNSISFHLISEAKKHTIPYGAICISTRILANAEALVGKKATGWNGDNALETFLKGHGAHYEKKDIVTDGLVVTAVGPKAADLFAQGIIRVLTKKELQEEKESW
jgi:deglycase